MTFTGKCVSSICNSGKITKLYRIWEDGQAMGIRGLKGWESFVEGIGNGVTVVERAVNEK